MKILGLDPGTKNYGYALVNHKNNICIDAGMISTSLKEIKSLAPEEVKTYVNTMTPLIKKADSVVMERFQGRGLRGSLGETVSIMIGINVLICLIEKKPIHLTTAASWKNKVKRESATSLENLYKDCPTHHMLDAALMTYVHKDYFWLSTTKTQRNFMRSFIRG